MGEKPYVRGRCSSSLANFASHNTAIRPRSLLLLVQRSVLKNALRRRKRGVRSKFRSAARSVRRGKQPRPGVELAGLPGSPGGGITLSDLASIGTSEVARRNSKFEITANPLHQPASPGSGQRDHPEHQDGSAKSPTQGSGVQGASPGRSNRGGRRHHTPRSRGDGPHHDRRVRAQRASFGPRTAGGGASSGGRHSGGDSGGGTSVDSVERHSRPRRESSGVPLWR